MLKTKKISILVLLIAITLAAIGTLNAATLDEHWICAEVSGTEQESFSDPITCVEETKTFLETDEQFYVVAKLSSVEAGTGILVEAKDSSGNSVYSSQQTIDQSYDPLYGFRKIRILENELKPGDYSIKLFINGAEELSDTFTIEPDLSETCEAQDGTCCPSGYVCVSPKEGTCDSGTCCEEPTDCTTFSAFELQRREVTNCEKEGLVNCSRVVKLYEYSIHGVISPEQIAVITYRGIDVDCYDKDDVKIAYYDDDKDDFIDRGTYIEEIGEGIYEASALISRLGYVALVRSKECVPMDCSSYGGYKTDPHTGYVNAGNDIEFEICGMVKECVPSAGDECDKQCPGTDPDCDTCTSNSGDCCSISYDEVCDKDCAEGVDPDCCNKDGPLCCPGDSKRTGSEGCDKNCGTSDESCSDCTSSPDDCCHGEKDGVCDSDCPQNLKGVFADIDCCEQTKGVTATKQSGDCCLPACDDVCDLDCMPGIDRDCYSLCHYCGDGSCYGGESSDTCPQDCGAPMPEA